MARPDLVLFGDEVELDPRSALAVDNALGPQDLAVVAGVQGRQDPLDVRLGEHLGGLFAPGGEHLVGVVVMVVAGAVGVIALVVVVMVVMVVVIMIVMVLVFPVVMVMMVLMLIMVMMVVLMLVLRLVGGVLGPHLFQQLIRQGHLLNGGEDDLAVQLVPGGGEDGGVRVLLPQHGHGGLQLLLAQLLGPGEDDGAGGLDLVVVELAEVLHVDLHLGGVRHGDEAVQLHVVGLVGGVLHRHDHVGQLPHAGGLDEDAVRVELGLHVLQGLVEVPHQGAADAPGGHLADLDAGLLQKAAVDADLAELVLDEHQLLAGEGLRQQLLDEGGLAGPQEAGDDVDLGHGIKSFA